MAGGKETPRQKLIGLMYLVLLALLALQVSDTVMERFFFLESSLIRAKDESTTRNINRVGAMVKKVGEMGNKPVDVAKLTAAQELRAKTKQLVEKIAEIRQSVIFYCSGTKNEKETVDPEKGGLYIQAKEEQKVAEYLELNGSKEGKALKNGLDEYVNYLNGLKAKFPELANKKFEMLAFDGKDDPIFKNNPEQKGKNFLELNFHHTPLVAAVAVLADKQNKVLNYEADVLSSFSVGEEVITFDEVVPMYSLESRIVAAGTKAKGKIFVAGKDSKLIPTISLTGAPVKIVEGVGEFEFTASGGAYDPETRRVKQSKAFHISMPFKGSTKEFDGKLEYEVAEPQIEVSSGAVSALYLECNNPLKIKVPALGAEYNPSFNCSGGSIKKGASIGDAIVYPTNPAGVEIGVNSDGTNLGSVKFKTKAVPNPSFEVKTGGRPVDFLKGERNNIINVTIKAVPDAGFAAACPDDAVYQIASCEAALIVGGGVRKTTRFTSGVIRVGDLNPNPGSRIFIKIEKLVRITATGDQKEVKMPDQSRIFNISFIE